MNTRRVLPDRPRRQLALIHPKEQYEPVFQGSPFRSEQTTGVGRIYPEFNRVHFDVMAEGEFGALSDVLTLRLSHSAPWFAIYRITVDGKLQESSEEIFRWNLNPGANRLELRVVDAMGRVGPPSRLTVRYQPAKQAR